MRWAALMCAGALVAASCAPAGRQVFPSSPRAFVVQNPTRRPPPPCALPFPTPDDNLLLPMGEQFAPRYQAQNLGNDLGKIIPIRPDGSVPGDNPFVGRPAARPEIWSYGHRNPRGLALHPVTGKLWEHGHGPRGGDEVNIIEKGKNYGGPVIGYGIDDSGAKIHESTHKAR